MVVLSSSLGIRPVAIPNRSSAYAGNERERGRRPDSFALLLNPEARTGAASWAARGWVSKFVGLLDAIAPISHGAQGMPAAAPITLKEVQVRLRTPQHVLIHLCEKGVIEPDFTETTGRGKRREFSERNVFEFAVALALRKIDMPVAKIALVVRVLRTFTRAVARASANATLLEDSLELALNLYGVDLMVLSAYGKALREPVHLGAKVDRHDVPPRVTKLRVLPSHYETRLEINLSEIARSSRTHLHE